MGRTIEVSISEKKEAPKPNKNLKINQQGKASGNFRGIGKGYDKRNKK
jgi:hypothetical protein